MARRPHNPPRPPAEERPPAPPPRDGRDAACRLLAHHAANFPDLVPAPIDDAELDPREAGLAHAIADTAIRRWLTLAMLLGHALNRPLNDLEPRMRAVLLSGAAQLLLLDRLPPHAVIDESVEWAKRHVRPGAAGMTNAVLRRIAGLRSDPREAWTDRPDELPLADGSARGLTAGVLDDDPVTRTAQATGLPLALVRRWVQNGTEDRARTAALHTLIHAPVVVRTAGVESLPGSLRPHDKPGHHVLDQCEDIARLLGSLGPNAWVQDPASSEAVESVRDLTPRTVIDVCAGQGTKTRQLRAAFPDAKIVAAEVDRARLDTLAGVFGDDDAVAVRHVRELLPEHAGTADLVLLDVPCSNTGVLARRPEARHRWSKGQTKRLNDIQRQILADALPLLAPAGRILYSTCSLEPEENQQITRWARQQHGFSIDRERTTWPAGIPGEPPTTAHDGSYSALLTP